MVTKIFQNNRYSSTYTKRVADTVEDAKKIVPTAQEIGSELYIIETKSHYILDSKGTWSNYDPNGDDVTCDCVSESTIWEDLPEENEAN